MIAMLILQEQVTDAVDNTQGVIIMYDVDDYPRSSLGMIMCHWSRSLWVTHLRLRLKSPRA